MMDVPIRRPIAEQMVEQGYATPKHVAMKLQKNIGTIYRMMDGGKLRWKEVLGLKYIEIASVCEWAGPEGVAAIGLNDWSDYPR